MITEIKTNSRDEWLNLRKNYIGGSEAAAVVGLDDYKSAYTLWAEKTHRVEPFEGNLTTQVGAYLEEFVAKLFTEQTGKKVRRKNRTLVNDAYPFACADVDRMIVGENALLEIKTTNSIPAIKQIKDDEYPVRWYTQMTHYLAVTGLDKAYLAVLVNCRDLKIYELVRDQNEIDILMSAEQAFWTYVTEDRSPIPDGLETTATTLATMYPTSQDRSVCLFGRDSLLSEYVELKDQKKAIDDRLDTIENIVKDDLKDAQEGYCGPFSISWKSQIRKTFQTKTFEKEHPEFVLEAYYKDTIVRPLKITQAA